MDSLVNTESPSVPLPWLSDTPSTSHTVGSSHKLDVDKIIRPNPLFLEDVVMHPSTAVPLSSVPDESNSNDLCTDIPEVIIPVVGCPPTSATITATAATSDTHGCFFPGADTSVHAWQHRKTRHYDDEDYRSHRHRAYPHMHHPLKVMEPRTLRRFREQVLAIRTGSKHALGVSGTTASVTDCTTDAILGEPTSTGELVEKDDVFSTTKFFKTDQHVQPTLTFPAFGHIPEDSEDVTSSTAPYHQVDPASPSLADNACSVGQAVKSRRFETGSSWSIFHGVDRNRADGLLVDVHDPPLLQHQQSPAVPGGLKLFTIGSAPDSQLFKDSALDLKRKLFKSRRHRPRSKPLSVVFQPSLTKLSEEASPMSSSTASSSTLSIEAADQFQHHENPLQPTSSICSGTPHPILTKVFDSHETMSSNCTYPIPLTQLESFRSSASEENLHNIQGDGCEGSPSSSNSEIEISLPDDPILEPEAEDVSAKFPSPFPQVTSSPEVALSSPGGSCRLKTPSHPSISPLFHSACSRLDWTDGRPLGTLHTTSPHPVDGDSFTGLLDLEAPLARPESTATEDGSMVKGDNVGPLRLARTPPYLSEKMMSELSVRTLTGLELKELNRIRRQMQRSPGQQRNSQDTDVGSEKNAVELKSHRFFELPGTRRRLCTRFHRSFMTPQRSWSVLEQAATVGPSRPDVVASYVVPENGGLPGQRTKGHRVSRAARRITRKDASFSAGAAPNPTLGHVVENNQSPSQGFGESVDAFPDADVFGSKLSALRLLRADGDPLDYLPPVFVELDILTCPSVGVPGPETGSTHPNQEQSASSQHPSHWLETARWVRYEEDLDLLAGNFGQAHSPPLTFHAVVECRRYLEQGAIVLQSKKVDDQPPPQATSKVSQSHHHAAGYSAFSELDSAMDVLRNDCGASTEDVALILNALRLRHHHVCDLPHQPLELSGNWLASRSQGLQFSRAVTSVDLQRPHNAGDGKRTASVPTLRGLNATTVQPSHRFSSVPIGQRALSLLHRALTPTGTERPSCTPPVQSADRYSPDIQQECLEVTPSVVRSPGEDTKLDGYHLRVPSNKNSSDLQGRLRPSTEVVSVQVGVLPGLRTPLLVFLRLHRPLFIPDFTELSDSYPVRFIVLFLGPDRRHLDYGQVGRVLATMMVDKAFRSVAYTASCRDDLLDGLRVFLDTTIVVPLLGDITPRSLLAMHDQIRLFRHSRQLGDVTRRHKTRLTRPTKRSRSRSCKARADSHHKRSDLNSTHLLVEAAHKVPEHHTSVATNTAVSPGRSFHPLGAAAAVRRKHLSPDHLQNVPQSTSETNVDCNLHPPREPIDGCCPTAGSERSDCVHRRKNRCPSYESVSSSGGSEDDRPIVPSQCTCGTWTGFLTSRCGFRFGSALCTDLVAYRHRFYSDLVEPFDSGDCTAVGSLFSTVIFLYFVVLAPALTFGALLNSTVSEDFSIPLCIFASGISQCLFTVLGGQPLLIVGITGPMLILETCIKLVCDVHQVPFLLMRLLIACYTTVLGLVAVIANAGWLVLRVRRSVEEVFNFFVSFYFVFKAMKNLFGELLNTASLATASHGNSLEQLNTSNTSHQWTAALTTTLEDQLGHHYAKTVTTLLLAFLMLFICLWLQSIKRGRYFRRTVRNVFGYLNVPIGLAITVCANSLLFPGIRAPTIQIPIGNRSFLFLVTSSPILASSEVAHAAQMFLGSPKFHGLAFLLAACLVPAIATDTMLSGITVAKSERRLRKPCLFSLDLTVTLCILPLVSSLLGWPFLSPAAVRSNAHAIALTKWNTRTPPGVPHRIVGCVEQRLTGFVIGLLVALSVIVEAQLFALIPMGALYGMFMYMGIMGLRELVVVHRLLALFKRRKHWRDREYLRHLPTAALASFVAVQMGFIVLLLALNWTTEFARIGATSLLFPFILLLFGVVREFLLPRFRLLRSYLHEIDRLHNLHLPRNPQFHRNCCRCSGPLHPPIRGDSLSESKPRNSSKLNVVNFLQRENQSIITDQLPANDSREHFSKASSHLPHTAWTVSSELDHLVSKDERPSFKYNSWTKLSVLYPSGSPVDMTRNANITAEGSGFTNVDESRFLPSHDVPSSSLSLSSVEECSESELELRMDNPYCLD